MENNKKTFWRDKYGNLIIWKLVLLGAIGLFIFITILCSFTTVRSGEVGLKVRFGKIVDTSISEGINFKVPYIERIVRVDIKVQKSELEVESSTKDLQIINTTIAVNYRVNSEKATHLYKTVGNSYEETILQPAIKESIKSAIAKYNAEEITVNRAEVSKSCLEALQEKVEKYGIVIEDFNLTNFSFSEEYTKAVEEKQVAEQNLEKAKLESEQKIIEAEATNKSNQLLKENITEEVLEQKIIEKWDGKLPTVIGGDGVFNLTDLIK